MDYQKKRSNEAAPSRNAQTIPIQFILCFILRTLSMVRRRIPSTMTVVMRTRSVATGTVPWNSSWLAQDMPWGQETSGGFLTCVTEMEEVSFMLTFTPRCKRNYQSTWNHSPPSIELHGVTHHTSWTIAPEYQAFYSLHRCKRNHSPSGTIVRLPLLTYTQ